MSYYEDDRDDGWSESAYDAGWFSPDDIDELRDLLKVVDLTKPTPGDRAMAALVLIDLKINPITADNKVRSDELEDPVVTWAKALLGGSV